MEIKHEAIHKKNQAKLYWLLQIVGWFSLLFIELFNVTFFVLNEFLWRNFYFYLTLSIIGLLATHFYKVLFIPKSTFEKGLGKIWSKALLDVILISLIIVVISTLAFSIEKGFSIEFELESALKLFGPRFMNTARYVILWIIIYYLYHILQRNNALQKANLEAENKSKINELELLKSQLNPHFLFNTLNSIKALVLVDAPKSRQAIIQLSELLRFSLNYEKQKLISLKAELEEVKKYMELEKIRFGDRLKYEISISQDLEEITIPPASILTLAENAIKQGINQNPENDDISIVISLVEGQVQIEVSNSGVLKGENFNGIGLKNIRKRFLNIYGEDAQLTIKNNQGKVKVQLKYPITEAYNF